MYCLLTGFKCNSHVVSLFFSFIFDITTLYFLNYYCYYNLLIIYFPILLRIILIIII